jgi:hypothetical protein
MDILFMEVLDQRSCLNIEHMGGMIFLMIIGKMFSASKTFTLFKKT